MNVFYLLTALIIFSCGKKEINFEENLYEKEGVFYINDTNEAFSGNVFSHYDNNVIAAKGVLEAGKRDQSWMFWYKNKQKKEESIYSNGYKNGLSTKWYINGVKKVQGSFKKGTPDGLYTEWYKNRQKSVEGVFLNGEENGLSTRWYIDGKKKEEGSYKNGEKDGSFTFWSKNGKKKVKYYKNGLLIPEKILKE